MDFDDFDKMDAGGAGKGEGPDDFDFDGETDTAEPGTGFGGEVHEFSAPAGQTSFFGYFGKGLRMALLKGDAAEEVAADPGAFVPALFIYAFPSVLGGLILFLLPSLLFNAMIPGGDAASAPPQFNAVYTLVTKVAVGFVFILPLFAIIGSLISVGVMHLIAKLFRGEGRFLDYYQTVGVGSLVSWGGIIPVVGTLFSLWMLPVLVVITARVHNLSTGRAVAVVLLPVVIVVVLVIALFSTMMMAMMGSGGMHHM